MGLQCKLSFTTLKEVQKYKLILPVHDVLCTKYTQETRQLEKGCQYSFEPSIILETVFGSHYTTDGLHQGV